MLTLAEQEHWDHELGAASELQNALSLSRMEQQLRDPMIDNSLSHGKHVVVTTYDAFCPRTDAAMGQHEAWHSEHDTREEAEAELERLRSETPEGYEGGAHIEPRQATPVEPTTEPDDLVPF